MQHGPTSTAFATHHRPAPASPLPAEAFEAVWGAIHVDLGFKIDVAKKSYALLFPVEG